MTPDLKIPDGSDATPVTPVCNGEGHWLAILAHELRTPLNSVCMALEELGEACEADPALAPARDTVARGCRLMALIIEDVLSLHRGRYETTPSSRGRVDVPVVVADAVEVARPMLIARRHRLSVAIPAFLPSIEGHAFRLKQVLINLLTNAAKFTEPGGGLSVCVEHGGEPLTGRHRRNTRNRFKRKADKTHCGQRWQVETVSQHGEAKCRLAAAGGRASWPVDGAAAPRRHAQYDDFVRG